MVCRWPASFLEKVKFNLSETRSAHLHTLQYSHVPMTNSSLQSYDALKCGKVERGAGCLARAYHGLPANVPVTHRRKKDVEHICLKQRGGFSSPRETALMRSSAATSRPLSGSWKRKVIRGAQSTGTKQLDTSAIVGVSVMLV